MSRRSRRRAACALASVLVFASGCALHESRVRYRSLAREYARESQAAPAGDTLAFANADALAAFYHPFAYAPSQSFGSVDAERESPNLRQQV